MSGLTTKVSINSEARTVKDAITEAKGGVFVGLKFESYVGLEC